MNALGNEHSAYLRSASSQPVNWLAWSTKAFVLARTEQKVILLDIGAVWCHWCHVMDAESYENHDVAELINRHFIAIKVDRDERPDVDARYQTAVSMVSGQGGWPLTAFLTPEGTVFYGGTYFPPVDRSGRPGFSRVLQAVVDAYNDNRAMVLNQAGQINEALKGHLSRSSEISTLSPEMLDEALATLLQQFDSANGGFGQAPKFPHTSAIDFLLGRAHQTGDDRILNVAVSTLKRMSMGGIHDQLGGGFHRYSTDERWIVPHFEKMLYDNAGLLENYVHALRVTNDPTFRVAAIDTARFLLDVLHDSTGPGFAASQDADVAVGDDGGYFTWTFEEIRAALTTEEFEVLRLHYALDGPGEMPHNRKQHVLFVAQPPEETAKALSLPVGEVTRLIRSGREKLLRLRATRPPPFVDRMLYTNWNAMAVSAMCEAYKILNDDAYRSAAIPVLDRLMQHQRTANGLMAHAPHLSQGIPALDDQVQTGRALLSVFEVTGAPGYLNAASELMERTIEQFRHRGTSAFHDIAGDAILPGSLRLPFEPIHDSPTPSANAVAIGVLLQLHALSERSDFLAIARETLEHFAGAVRGDGLYAGAYFTALDRLLFPPPSVIVVGDPKDPKTQELLRTAWRSGPPGTLGLRADTSTAPGLSPAVKAMVRSTSGPQAFVCVGQQCSPPTASPAELAETLRASARTPS